MILIFINDIFPAEYWFTIFHCLVIEFKPNLAQILSFSFNALHFMQYVYDVNKFIFDAIRGKYQKAIPAVLPAQKNRVLCLQVTTLPLCK